MDIIKGIVKAVSNKDGKYGIKIGEYWMNAFGECPVKKGDEVEIEYEVNGNYKNIKNIKTTKPYVEDNIKQDGISETARLRRKTDCIGYAIELVKCGFIKDTSIKEIKKTAEELENWIEDKSPKLFGIPIDNFQ
ncbi:MAG: hypothetical protein AABY22_13135 [Nanoarchaeota archaeon]